MFRLPGFLVFDPSLQSDIKIDYSYVSEQVSEIQSPLENMGDRSPDDPALLKVLGLQCFQLSVHRILNAILQAHSPQDDELLEDAAHCGERIEELVHRGSIANPLGATWIPLGLIAIWATAHDEAEKVRAEKLWHEAWDKRTLLSTDKNATTLAANIQKLHIDGASHRLSWMCESI